KLSKGLLIQPGRIDIVALEHDVEVLAMQDIQSCERPAAVAARLHGGLVQATPRVGELVGVYPLVAMLGKEPGSFPGDARTPIYDGAKYIETKRFHFHLLPW